jgi:hypothetical protein
MLNETFFKRILIGEDGQVVGAELSPVYEAMRPWHPLGGSSRTRKPRCRQGPGNTNPDPCFGGRGSYFPRMVEAGGIEPPTQRCKRCVFPLAPRPRGRCEL